MITIPISVSNFLLITFKRETFYFKSIDKMTAKHCPYRPWDTTTKNKNYEGEVGGRKTEQALESGRTRHMMEVTG